MELIEGSAVGACVVGSSPDLLAPSVVLEGVFGFLEESFLGEGDVLFELFLLDGEVLLAPLEAGLGWGRCGESPTSP